MSPVSKALGVAAGDQLQNADGASVKESTRRAGDPGFKRSARPGPIQPGDSSEIRRYPAAVTEHKAPAPADKADATPGVVKLVAKSPAEISQGAGLGTILSPEEGQARLDAYATQAKGDD